MNKLHFELLNLLTDLLNLLCCDPSISILVNPGQRKQHMIIVQLLNKQFFSILLF